MPSNDVREIHTQYSQLYSDIGNILQNCGMTDAEWGQLLQESTQSLAKDLTEDDTEATDDPTTWSPD